MIESEFLYTSRVWKFFRFETVSKNILTSHKNASETLMLNTHVFTGSKPGKPLLWTVPCPVDLLFFQESASLYTPWKDRTLSCFHFLLFTALLALISLFCVCLYTLLFLHFYVTRYFIYRSVFTFSFQPFTNGWNDALGLYDWEHYCVWWAFHYFGAKSL